MDFGRISRRHLLQGSAALTLGTALGVRSAFAADTTIGFIYVGRRTTTATTRPTPRGAAVKKMPGVKVVEEEKVAGDRRRAEDHGVMINLDGAKLLFPTSFGYFDPHMLKMAKNIPNVRFCTAAACGPRRHPKNVGSYFGYIDEANTSPASSPAT